MSHHLIALTIDADPDGSARKDCDRAALVWDGLDYVAEHACRFTIPREEEAMPITWFVRADGQLRQAYGRSTYLLERYVAHWDCERMRGCEIGWHPHLYHGVAPELMDDPARAVDELESIWAELAECGFIPSVFRKGEAWHLKSTMDTIESLGIQIDSSAVPGRRGPAGHPRNWEESPNHPYYPDTNNIRLAGTERAILEVPMTTWRVEAPWDAAPTLRHMNPAMHPEIFARAVDAWQREFRGTDSDVYVWVLVTHPDEIAPSTRSDGLIAHDWRAVLANVAAFTAAFDRLEQSWEFATLSDAAARWKNQTAFAT